MLRSRNTPQPTNHAKRRGVRQSSAALPRSPQHFRALITEAADDARRMIGSPLKLETIDQPDACDLSYALQNAVSKLYYDCRFDWSDPVAADDIRHSLARIAAICEAWDKHLNS